MKKIIVCGDSWNSPSRKPGYTNTHWSELLANELNLGLLSFAQPGGSNKAIAVQVLDAIQMNPALIIFGPCTNNMRVEIMGHEFNDKGPVSLKHFYYGKGGQGNPIDANNNDKNKLIESTPISQIDDKTTREIYAKTYSNALNLHIDTWCLLYALRCVEVSNIPYMMYPGIHEGTAFKNHMYSIFGNEDNVLKSTVYDHRPYWQNLVGTFFDPGYHTPPEVQIEVKDVILKFLKDNNIFQENKI